jgi:hypothetical protein
MKSVLLAAALVIAAAAVIALPAQATPGENLKVLPAGMDKKDIKPIMKSWSKALGVECDHCHSDDGAAIDTENKEVARTMFKMMSAMNAKYFKKGDDKLTCNTCHQGNKEPKK